MGRWLIAITVFAAAASLVACSSNSKTSGTPTAAGTGTAQATTSPGASTRPTPFPTPAVQGSTYTFAVKGYAIDAPAGWTAQPNHLFDPAGSRFPADVFFAPDSETVNGIQPNISVACLKPQTSQGTTDAFRDYWEQYLGQIVHSQVPPQATTVGGQPAYRFDYTQPLPEQTGANEAKAVHKVDVLLVQGGCRWMVTLTAPSGDTSATGAFDTSVSSMKFTG
jgi:hypothetical protein